MNYDLDDTEPIITISMPLTDACMICIGGKIENEVVRKFIRNQIVGEIGVDVYIEAQDKINAHLLGKQPSSYVQLDDDNVLDFNNKPKRGKK